MFVHDYTNVQNKTFDFNPRLVLPIVRTLIVLIHTTTFYTINIVEINCCFIFTVFILVMFTFNRTVYYR